MDKPSQGGQSLVLCLYKHHQGLSILSCFLSRPGKLSLEDQLLMTLEYLREYRTYFHISQSWQVNESTAYRIIRKIEEVLMQSRAFTLPGKKKLSSNDYQIEVVVVDVTESQIERPKKTKKVL